MGYRRTAKRLRPTSNISCSIDDSGSCSTNCQNNVIEMDRQIASSWVEQNDLVSGDNSSPYRIATTQHSDDRVVPAGIVERFVDLFRVHNFDEFDAIRDVSTDAKLSLWERSERLIREAEHGDEQTQHFTSGKTTLPMQITL